MNYSNTMSTTLLRTMIHADHTTIRRLGHHTQSREFQIQARRSKVVIDLRSALIEPGDITIDVDIDHSTIKLLVAAHSDLDQQELTFRGRGRVKRTFHHPSSPATRTVRLRGRVHRGEIRVLSGGPAQLAVIFTREFFVEARAANREGREPALLNPGAIV